MIIILGHRIADNNEPYICLDRVDPASLSLHRKVT